MNTPTAYRQIRRLGRYATQTYFREVAVEGLEDVPERGGGLIIAWHPNGVIDPALIFSWFPRKIVFGARSGLFKVPGFGQVIQALDAVPIYRAQDSSGDPEARRAANVESLSALSAAIAGGSWACLFPEGDSHDLPTLLALKTGAARLYYQARADAEARGLPVPVILIAKLHYDAKQAFRSDVLVDFQPPMPIPPALDVTPPPDEDPELHRERCRALTDEIERQLHDVTDTTDDWDLHHLLHRGRKLLRAERARRTGVQLERESVLERAEGFGEIRDAYYARCALHPDPIEAMLRRLEAYDIALTALHIEDHEIDRDPRLFNRWLLLILALQGFAVFVLVPPFIALGVLVHLPIALGLWALSKVTSSKIKDESSVKLMFGAAALPMTWLALGLLAARAHAEIHAAIPTIPDLPVLAGALFVLISILGAGLALRYLRVARQTGRALRVLLTRRRARRMLGWLQDERSALYDAIMEMYRLPAKPEPDQPTPPR